MRVSTAVFGLFLMLAGAAQAQEVAGNFDQLRVVIRRGETIHIKDTDDQEIKGELLDLSPGGIRILTKGMTREFNVSDVDVITASRHGSLATGAKWGFGTGAGFGGLWMLTLMSGAGHCGGECAAYFTTAVLVYGGIGAGIGVGVAAMTTSQHVIFARTGASERKISLAPLVDEHRKGAMVSVSW
jgi:hypothetical protein